MLRSLSFAVGLLSLGSLAVAGCGGGSQPGPVAPNAAPAPPLANGIYLVREEIPVMAPKPPQAGPGERVVRFDPTKVDSLSREAARFVRVEVEDHHGLVNGEPQVEPTEDGKQLLFLQLDEGTAKGLEGWARQHEGTKVAVVVDGDITSVHKIRDMEKLGHLRIARCTERGCNEIQAKLRKH